jgi:hypothetical protein
MKKFVTGLVTAAFCCLASSAWAQSAQTVQPTARQIELANQVMAITGIREKYSILLHTMMKQQSAQMSVGASSADQRSAAVMQSALSDEVDKMVPEMVDVTARIYAKVYTEKELSDLIVFYGSPSGQSMLAKSPGIMRESQAAIFPLIPLMQRDLIEDFCRQLPCTADMKQKFMDRLSSAQPKE